MAPSATVAVAGVRKLQGPKTLWSFTLADASDQAGGIKEEAECGFRGLIRAAEAGSKRSLRLSSPSCSRRGSRLCFHGFHDSQRARLCDRGAVVFVHVIDPTGLDDKIVALIGALLLQEHELIRVLLRLGNAEWRKGLNDSSLGACIRHLSGRSAR